MLKSHRLLLAGFIVVSALAFSSRWYDGHSQLLSRLTEQAGSAQDTTTVRFNVAEASLKDVRNSTLGFEKLFIINLPERFDKLDAFVLASSLTGFEFDVIEGVKGKDVSNKTLRTLEGLPKKEEHRNNIVGCWRAHLNFARTIIERQLSSALVLEDDADWDTHLKDQLSMFAHGSQFVTGVTADSTPHSPYGDDWDLLWLGHCGSRIKPSDERRLIIKNDATVPPPERRFNVGQIPNMEREGYDDTTRIVYHSMDSLCLYAYALSYRGARKLLRAQTTRDYFTPIDIGIGQMCTLSDFKCIGVFPQMFDSHRPPGRLVRDSDIGTYSADEIRSKGYTFNIVHSTRLNMDHLLAGEMDLIERQWPDDPKVVGPPLLVPEGRRVKKTID